MLADERVHVGYGSALAELRAAASQHESQLQAASWLGTRELMTRWGVGRATVLRIPREQLPYLEFGSSKMRRYAPDDVARFEAEQKCPAQEKD